MTLLIILKDRDSNTKQYSFSNKNTITAGRKETNDIILPDPTVSLYHFKIVYEEEKYYIEDLNSTNGTFLNGMPVKKAEIKNEDLISVSIYTLKIKTVNIKIPKAEIYVEENPVDERKIFILNKTTTFIGTGQKADIPAKPQNIFYPLSDFVCAIVLKEGKYYITPINEDQIKLNSEKIKNPSELKTNDIIEVGITKLIFKYT